MTAAAAFAEAQAQVTRCLDKLTNAPGRDEPCEQGMVALYGIQAAINSIGNAITDLDGMSDGLETVLDLLHDMASDVTGRTMKLMEQPEHDPHAHLRAVA
jgi:phage-related minor tail protein